MDPLIFPTIIFLMIFGIISVIHPLIIVKLLYLWPKYIFPKIFLEEKFLSNFKKNLNILNNAPKLYENQNRSQVFIIRITGIASLFMSFLSICGIVTKLFNK